MRVQNNVLPISVNLHFWRPCNMRCGFCFATYEDTAKQLPRGHLPRESLLRLIEALASHGAKKLTFVGGEPTLCPWLGELITHAKQRGMTTMMVSNGWRLRDPDYMRSELRDLDWLTLSVDSIDFEHNLRSGRAHQGKRTMSAQDLLLIGANASKLSMRLKLNTVVHAHNLDEDLSCFVAALGPSRWKLFQVLPVVGQNDARIDEFEIDTEGFKAYVERHAWLEKLGVTLVAEDNADMRGTYAMIDPRGCFFDTVEGRHRYSEPILEVGVVQAWSTVGFSNERFVERGGVYDFVVPATSLRVRSDGADD
jgi:radical S-adenosyl methionine domain-containing protein 2